MSKGGGGATDLMNRHFFGKYTASNGSDNRVKLIERMYMAKLTELAMNRFEWSGLPDSINVRFMEMSLFNTALSVFYYDQKFERYFALRGTPSGTWNMYNEPTSFTTIGNGYTSKTLPIKESYSNVATDPREGVEFCVPIWANYLRMSDWDTVFVYASKLAEIDRTIEINAKSARRTKVIVASENTRLSAENINQQIDDGKAVVKVNMDLGDMVTSVDLGVDPDGIERLKTVRNSHWNECMTLLGIDNANQDKTERLVSDEVDANREQISSTRAINLNARRAACNEINKRWPDLNIWVDYKTEEKRPDVNPPENLRVSD